MWEGVVNLYWDDERISGQVGEYDVIYEAWLVTDCARLAHLYTTRRATASA